MFVVLEGIDGSGKGTQAAALCRGLKDAPAGFGLPGRTPLLAAREPTDGRIGRLIREYLKGAEAIDPRSLALLFTADRLDGLQRGVLPHLRRGGIVVSDRYAYSTVAYQGAEGIDVEWICALNRDIVTPDLVIYLDIDPPEAIKRLGDASSDRARQEREIFEKSPGFLKRVRRIYLDIAGHRLKVRGEYGFLNARFEVIDGTQPPEQVADRIKSCVMEALKGGT